MDKRSFLGQERGAENFACDETVEDGQKLEYEHAQVVFGCGGEREEGRV